MAGLDQGGCAGVYIISIRHCIRPPLAQNLTFRDIAPHLVAILMIFIVSMVVSWR